MEELYAVSTADALLLDPSNDTLVIKATALLNSSMEQTMQQTELNAGRGSKLKFIYNYQKVLAFQIEAADFSPVYLALQTGSEIKNKMSKYFTEETVKFDSTGKGTLSQTPIGNVYVESPANHVTKTPTGSVITDIAYADKELKVVYQYNAQVDELTIGANDFPKAYKLVLTSDIFNADGDKAYEQQIEVPRYKLDGALNVNLAHDSVAQFALNGKALTDDDMYATVKWIPVNGTVIKLASLATDVAEVTLGVGEKQKVITYGVRGAGYGNVLMNNTKLTFTSDDEAVATFVNGEITGIGAGETNVKVSDGTYTDVIEVVVS
ncbi:MULTISPECIES: hypothetical protein [Lysinibacillus]|uniref:hypothetical protein n=1 Tax=Lysinibacillus TaxID=400634 RepID=UPI00214B7CB0|nr:MULTISPECIES: hypothetical protein [Lysinibacillus]UUV25857.1 hypothetical protein NP781_04375 [Lysinibacillus sp. FN11]UYB48731.1 hypothetical protein OCI51_07170 [Lysinibacillus capsici]